MKTLHLSIIMAIIGLVAGFSLLEATAEQSSFSIPTWIKENAKWWSEGKIGDFDFALGIQYLFGNNGIMKITSSEYAGRSTNSSNLYLPQWIKHNAFWWVTGQISDEDFVTGIQYLVENRIINLQNLESFEIWRPIPGSTLNVQFDNPINSSFNVNAYDIDLFDNNATMVKSLHEKGAKVICYISVGSWENWRPDADAFSPYVIGKDYQGWPGEKWLDIRKIDVIGPIIEKRFDLCKAKGFDGADTDNMDGYQSDTGFQITYNDQLQFNIWLANQAHARGLSIGLKNDPDQVVDLLPYFDWALVEECYVYNFCDKFEMFVNSGKAVFQVEYVDSGITKDQFCPQSIKMNFSGILKQRNLTANYESCR